MKQINDSIKDLYQYLEKLENFSLPTYKELPSIPLYMEQVVSYISEILGPLFDNKDQQVITPFMINNYVKAKIISATDQKKYKKNHIGYLIAISLLKNVSSIKDIATLIEVDSRFNKEDKENLFFKFKTMQDEVIKNQSRKVITRLDAISKKKNTDEEELVALTYIALKLYIESEATKLLADTITNKIFSHLFEKNNDLEKEEKKELELKKKKVNEEVNQLKKTKN